MEGSTIADRALWKKANAQPLPPRHPLCFAIHAQAGDRGPADRCDAFNLSALSQGAEVLFPPISAGMKKMNLSLAHRVEATAVRRFAEIAGTARKRQVVYSIKPAKSDRGDVLDFEGEIEDCFRCVAILTPMLRS